MATQLSVYRTVFVLSTYHSFIEQYKRIQVNIAKTSKDIIHFVNAIYHNECFINLRNCHSIINENQFQSQIIIPNNNFPKMIKASLDFHDPIDIYDQLKTQFGNLSMLIKDNYAILTFENVMAKRTIIENPKRFIKGFPIVLRDFENEEEQKKGGRKINSLGQAFSNSMDLEDSSMEFQDTPLSDFLQFLNIKENFKKLKEIYDFKIKDIKQRFPDVDMCNLKISQFNSFFKINIQQNAYLKKPFQDLIIKLRKFSLNPISELIDIETTFSVPEVQTQEKYERKKINQIVKPYFENTVFNYSSADIGQVKRMCMLNDNNFVTTLKLNEKGQEKGQLRIYRKGKQGAQFSLDIQEGPYSLMMHENFILTGDFQGYIHMIDINNENQCEYSNKLSYSLIVSMQKYQNRSNASSILTLLTGERSDYKIKLFEIQREKITSDIDSLFFHPREEILCEGITMTLEALNDGRFAYGCGRNTYVCPSFNRYEREYVTHDQNVMKIKMKNPQELIEATQRKILSLDLRACKIKNNIFEFKHDIHNIQLLSEHYIFYGGKAGEVGVIDSRKTNVHLWSPPEIVHSGKISDILKMGNDVISSDNKGNIFEWKSKQFW